MKRKEEEEENVNSSIFLMLLLLIFFAAAAAAAVPEIVYINLDTSVSRRNTMEHNLRTQQEEVRGLRNFSTWSRLSAITPKDIFIPNDIMSSWNNSDCLDVSTWSPTAAAAAAEFNSLFPKKKKKKIFINGLCGVSSSNMLIELAVTISHLLAIRRAVYSETAISNYAVILEDDVWTPFDINYEAMADTVVEKVGPFGVLQLFNSKPVDLLRNWELYVNDKNSIVVKRPSAFDGRYLPSWSTGSYIINRMRMKPIIDAIISIDSNDDDGWIGFKILAGNTHPVCKPKICCDPTNYPLSCVYAPVGFVADSFIYALNNSYTLTIPVFTVNEHGRTSTVHQSHVSIQHKKSFVRNNLFLSTLLSRVVALPSYLKISNNSEKTMTFISRSFSDELRQV